MKISKKILKISSILGVSALSVSAGVVPFLQTSAKSTINTTALSAQKSSWSNSGLSPEDISDDVFSKRKEISKTASGYSVERQIGDARNAIYEWVLDGKASDSKIWDRGEMFYQQDWGKLAKHPSENMKNLDAFTDFFEFAKIKLPATSKDIRYDYKINIWHLGAPEYRIKYSVQVKVWGKSATGEIVEKTVKFNIMDKTIPDSKQMARAAYQIDYAKHLLQHKFTSIKGLSPSEFVKSVGDKATGKNLISGWDNDLNGLLGVEDIHFGYIYFVNHVKLDYELIPRDDLGEVWVKIKLSTPGETREETLRIIGFGTKGKILYKMSRIHAYLGNAVREKNSKVEIPDLMKTIPREGEGLKDLKPLAKLLNTNVVKVAPWSEDWQIVYDYKIDDSMYWDKAYAIANITMRSLVNPEATYKTSFKIYESYELTNKYAYKGLVEVHRWWHRGNNSTTKFKDKTLADILGQEGVKTKYVSLDYISELFGINKISLNPNKAKKFLTYVAFISVPHNPERHSEIDVSINVNSPGRGEASVFTIKGFKTVV